MSINPVTDSQASSTRDLQRPTTDMPQRLGHAQDARRDADNDKGAQLPPTRTVGGLRVGRLFGVEIRLDISLLIIFALIAFNLGMGVFPSWHPNWSQGLCWLVAFAAAAVFLGSVLVHEMAHALVGRMRGTPVPRITLFVFGGLAEMQEEPSSPASEFLIAVVGPLTSIAIGLLALFGVQWLAAPGFDFSSSEVVARADDLVAALGPIATLLLWLGPINLMLGIFNLVPGFPLDGGRVLRAVLWWGTSDLSKATRWAAMGGRLIAYALMALGVVTMFNGGFVQGLWLLFIGWFLNNAAIESVRQQLIDQALSGVPVKRLMRRDVRGVEPDMRIDDLAREMLWSSSDQRAFPVEHDGALLGLVCVSDLRKVPQDKWPTTSLREVLTPRSELTTLPPDASAKRALEVLGRQNFDQVPIVQSLDQSPDQQGEEPQAHLVGMVRRADLLSWVALQDRAA